jgi:hypothetical protein
MPVVADPYQQRPLTTRVREPQQRYLPEVSDDMRELSVARCIKLYSVGPWALQRNMGSWGIATIPGCPTERQWKAMEEKDRAKVNLRFVDGHRYVEMNPLEPSLCPGIPGIYQEPVIHDEKEFMLAQVGQKKGSTLVAEQVLGIGSHMGRHENWTRFGVFIGSERGPKAKPTEKELIAAEESLLACYWEYINEANEVVLDNRINPSLIIDNEHHRLSALEVGRTDFGWMSQASPQQRADCFNCGTKVNIGIIQCPQCRAVLDPVRYDENVMAGRIINPERYAQLSAATEPAAQQQKKR